MKMFVLAGGLGTRLRDAVPGVPKALAPIAHKNFLYFQLENWISQGIKEFVFLLCYQAEQIIAFLESEKDNLLNECSVQIVVETQLLDTGGAVANALKETGHSGDFLLSNADTWLTNGLDSLISSDTPCLGVVYEKNTARFGTITKDDSWIVTSFNEKNGSHTPGWINSGYALLSIDQFLDWNGGPYSLEKGLYPALVSKRQLHSVQMESSFIDIGVPEDYLRFNKWITGHKLGTL